MDRAIKILTEMLNELESSASATYMDEKYYDRMDAKIDAIKDAIERLEYANR